MSLKTRNTFGVIILSLTILITACSNTSWVYKQENNDVPSGVYITYLINAYTNAIGKVSTQLQSENKTLTNQDDVFKHKIDDQNADDWIKNEAAKASKEHLTINKLFANFELSLSEEDNSKINSSLDTLWKSYSNFYESNGASKNSVRLTLENTTKREKVFNKYYGESGVEAVSTEEIKKFFLENFVKTKYVLMPKTDGKGQALNNEKTAELKTMSENYLQRIKSGESIDTLIKEHEEYLSKQKADASGQAYTPSTSTTNPDNNFVVLNKQNSRFPQQFIDSIFGANFDTPILIESDTYFFVAIRYDLSNDEKNFSEYKTSSLYQLKESDFNSKIKESTDSLNITQNDSSINRYKPKNIKNYKVNSN